MDTLREIELIMLLINTQACLKVTGEFRHLQRSLLYKLQKELMSREQDKLITALKELQRIDPTVYNMFRASISQFTHFILP